MRPVAVLPPLILAGLLVVGADAQIIRADLRAINFSLSTTTLREGSVVTFTFDVENIGLADAGAFDIGVYLSTDSVITPDDRLLLSLHDPGLANGYYRRWTPQITIPLVTQGTFWAGIYADYWNVVPEYLESNNDIGLQVTCVPLKPDLEVSSLSSNPIAVGVGTPVRLSATVRNIGEIASPSTTAAFHLVRSSGLSSPTPLGVLFVPPLQVNQSVPLTLDVTIASVPHGGDASWLLQLAPISIPELSITNNSRFAWVRCNVTPNLAWNQTNLGPASSGFGFSVAEVGDIDGDGADDVIVGAPSDGSVIRFAGTAWVLSGRTGARLWSFPGQAELEYQGTSVAGAGDVDGDGVPDLLVGAPEHSDGLESRGRVEVYSGRTGTPLRIFRGLSAFARVGTAMAGVGDVDGDGFDDIAYTAPGDGSNDGTVSVYSGRTWTRVFQYRGPHISRLGGSLAPAGDVNRDGFPDLIVGATNDDGFVGAAHVLSGRNGQLLRRITASGVDDFGKSVAGIGDVDGDGFPDLAVGGFSVTGTGIVWLYSGRTFGEIAQVSEWTRDEYFGSSVAGGGDVNGDGTPDFVVGAPEADALGTSSGRANVLSGHDRSTSFSFAGWTPSLRFGFSLALVRDVNDDGRADLVVGAPGTNASAVQLFLTSGKTIGRSRTFGRPGATSGGLLPRAVVEGSPQIGRTVSLALRAAPPATPVLMLLGFVRTDVDLGPAGAPGSRLYTFPTLTLQLGTGADGRAALPIALPNELGLVGAQAFLQWAVFDPTANALGWVASDAARIVIGRL
jgi:hypothetical protein